MRWCVCVYVWLFRFGDGLVGCLALEHFPDSLIGELLLFLFNYDAKQEHHYHNTVSGIVLCSERHTERSLKQHSSCSTAAKAN